MSFSGTFKRPSAFLPVAMSLAAFAVVLGHIVVTGGALEADEGAPAHIWQLLMAGQIPIVAFFVFRWSKQTPRDAIPILALQACSAIAALAPVYFFNL